MLQLPTGPSGAAAHRLLFTYVREATMTTNDVYRDGMIHVQHRMCKTCIFRPGNKMNLQPGRVEQMVADCGDEGCIPCHQNLDLPGQAVCRGFFDKHRNAPLQIAARLGYIKEVVL